MDNQSKKIVKRVVGGSLILLAGITGFYQYQYNLLKSADKVAVVVAKNGQTIKAGDELTENNVTTIMRDKTTLVNGYYTSQDKILGCIAKKDINGNECISEDRIESKESYEEKDYKLVSIKGTEQSNDLFCGYEIKPTDKVDVLYYDKNGTYEGQPYLKGISVYDIKSSEGVSYDKKTTGFKPSYALIWVKPEIAEEINSRQEKGGYFKFTLCKDNED